jgi:hypothetical protein
MSNFNLIKFWYNKVHFLKCPLWLVQRCIQCWQCWIHDYLIWEFLQRLATSLHLQLLTVYSKEILLNFGCVTHRQIGPVEKGFMWFRTYKEVNFKDYKLKIICRVDVKNGVLLVFRCVTWRDGLESPVTISGELSEFIRLVRTKTRENYLSRHWMDTMGTNVLELIKEM